MYSSHQHIIRNRIQENHFKSLTIGCLELRVKNKQNEIVVIKQRFTTLERISTKGHSQKEYPQKDIFYFCPQKDKNKRGRFGKRSSFALQECSTLVGSALLLQGETETRAFQRGGGGKGGNFPRVPSFRGGGGQI